MNPREHQWQAARRRSFGSPSFPAVATGAGAGPSSGLSRQAAIASLTAQQAAALCDWTNAKQGGYGRDVTCSDGADQGTDADKQSCVESVHLVGVLWPTVQCMESFARP